MGNVKYGEERIQGREGTLFVRRWGEQTSDTPAVMILHGAGEHGGRHNATAERLAEAGFLVIAPDHYGLGQSEGTRGEISDFFIWVEDALKVIEKNELNKVIVLGHSMGGLIATAFALKYQERCYSLILTSPFFGFKDQPTYLVRAIGFLGRVVPRCPLPNQVNAKGVSRDPAVVERYLNDPLVYVKVNAGWVSQILRGQRFVFKNAPLLKIPLLILASGQDRLVELAQTKAFFGMSPMRDKEMQVFPDCYHELLNEPEKEEVLQRILEWVRRRA